MFISPVAAQGCIRLFRTSMGDPRGADPSRSHQGSTSQCTVMGMEGVGGALDRAYTPAEEQATDIAGTDWM